MSVRIPVTSTEYVTMRVTAPDGMDITGDSVEVAILGSAVKSPPVDTSWRTPDIVERPTADVVRAGLLIGPLGTLQLAAGGWRLWMRITDAPEVPVVSCPSAFTVAQ